MDSLAGDMRSPLAKHRASIYKEKKSQLPSPGAGGNAVEALATDGYLL